MQWLSTCSQRQECSHGKNQERGERPKRRCLIVTNREDSLSGNALIGLAERAAGADRGSENANGQYVVAADGGARIARLLGLRPDVVVGDLDSLSTEEMSCLAENGTTLVRFPSEKDETDSHLAMVWAADQGYDEISVVIQSAGRLDHVLGTVWAAAGVVERGVTVRFLDAGFEAVLVKAPAVVKVASTPPLIVSLIPVGGTARGIYIMGLKYPLTDATLGLGESRGISNETRGEPGLVEVGEGFLLVTAVSSQ